jgi:hypothetical protein
VIIDILSANGYPERVIKKVIKKYRYFKPNEPGPMNSINSGSVVLKRYSGLTYIPGISDKIAKKLTE